MFSLMMAPVDLVVLQMLLEEEGELIPNSLPQQDHILALLQMVELMLI